MDVFLSILLTAFLPGATGGTAVFLYGIQKKLYLNNHLVKKASMEIFGGAVTAAVLGGFFSDTELMLKVSLCGCFGIGWSGIIHSVRAKITRVVEAALGNAELTAAPKKETRDQIIEKKNRNMP